MYVRDAKNRDEVWLLDHIEEMGLDDVAFRSRDYVIALDEVSNERAGFGRIRLHKGDEDVCEITGLGVLPAWRGQGVGAHVIERLVDTAKDDGFDVVYVLALEPNYLTQFGFEPVSESTVPAAIGERLGVKRETLGADLVPMSLSVDEFEMPATLRERFKTAAPRERDDENDEYSAEEFGIDPDSATYKYDTGR